MTLHHGDIVIVSNMLDPQGRNPKDRPAVVVTPADERETDGPVYVVAITTTLPDPLPFDHVAIPWQRPKHPRTGLNERNAAVCHWLARVERDRIHRTIEFVPNAELARIGEALRRLALEDQPGIS